MQSAGWAHRVIEKFFPIAVCDSELSRSFQRSCSNKYWKKIVGMHIKILYAEKNSYKS